MIAECLIIKSASVPTETIESSNNLLQMGLVSGFWIFTKENKRKVNKERHIHFGDNETIQNPDEL